MTIRAAIYARTSHDCPLSNEDQIERLRTIAAERGWSVVQVFTDHPMSAKKGLDRRPGEVTLIDAIRSGTIDRVLVSSICRVGKSLIGLAKFIETCHLSGVSVYLHEQNTVASQSLCDMATLLALHLRQTRRDRILRGQAMARSLSIRFGRPPIATAKIEKAKRELSAGRGVREAARLAGISAASASRLKTSMSAPAAGI
jgi:DNA invertase Pin-like site-specific DNA recombinase